MFADSTIELLEIPNSVTTINDGSFMGTKLNSLKFQENSSLTTIGNQAFYGNNLTSVEIPASVTTIGADAFSYNRIKNLSFEENSNLTTTEGYPFASNQIESLQIPVTITNLFGSSSFKSDGIIKNLTIVKSQNSTTIENQISLYGVTKIEKLKVASGITQVGTDKEILSNNILLEMVEISNTVETIGNLAFGNLQIKKIIFEENSNLTTIENYAFVVNQLTNIEIPSSVTRIGDYAFALNNLKNITIGNNIQYIGNAAFAKGNALALLGLGVESNLNLESIAFVGKTCDEIKNIEASSSDATKYFPWLYDYSPYYLDGYKAKIIGTDGECSY